ncbi:MAG: serine/threonine-protein kinase, partial [Deltaproteobacteria bacterium]
QAWQTRGQDRLGWHLGVLRQVCNAVESAHRRGIVHRDLKPENVMVGDLGEVYVLDWGIAVILSEARSAELAGTPAYMAPEMLAGSADVTPRTDVYLLGAMLHEVLTGKSRHPGDEVWAVLASAFESEPHAYDEKVPPELAAICNRATACDPSERYAGALDLSDAIGEYLQHRGSLDLTAAAERVSEQLRAAIDVSASPAGTSGQANGDAGPVAGELSRTRVRSLGAEADFAFRQALAAWSGNLVAEAGRQRCLEMMIAFEIDQRNAPGAEALLAELRTDQPSLKARIAALRAEISDEAQAKARLALRDYEGDLSVSSQERVVGLIASFGGIGAVLLVLGLLGVTLSHAGFVAFNGVATVLSVVTVYVRRKTLLATEANRRVAARNSLLYAWGVLIGTVGWLSGATVDATLATYGFCVIVSIGSHAIETRGAALYMVVPMLITIVLCSFWPGHAMFALASALLLSALAAIPRALGRQPTTAPPA